MDYDRRKLFAQNVKHFAKLTGKKADEIAKDAKIDKSALYNYMAGSHAPIALLLPDLCRALKCTYEDLLGEI